MKMLHIREEQMAVFRAQAMQDFEARLLTHLRVDMPVLSKDHSDDDLRQLIRKAVHDGARHGVEREDDLYTYTETLLQLGPGFAKLPWAAKILRQQDLWPWEKMEQIQERAVLIVNKAS